MKNLLEYQKVDSEAIAIERKIMSSEFKKLQNQLLDVLKESKNKTNQLENKANDININFVTLKSKFDENVKMLDKLLKINLEKLNEKDASALLEKIATISNNVNFFERKLLSLAEDVNSTLKDFEIAKKRYGTASQKYKEAKINFINEENKLKPELDKIKSKLAVLEKDVPADLLKKYKAIRQDRIFPVFVPLMDKCCGGCRMELPSAVQLKIKDKGYIECDNCHRIIFFD